jgi:hypothetical protein
LPVEDSVGRRPQRKRHRPDSIPVADGTGGTPPLASFENLQALEADLPGSAVPNDLAGQRSEPLHGPAEGPDLAGQSSHCQLGLVQHAHQPGQHHRQEGEDHGGEDERGHAR